MQKSESIYSETEKLCRLLKKTTFILSPLAVLYLIRCNFTKGVRKSIKEDAHGICSECGTYVGVSNLIAAHTFHFHDRQDIPAYNTPSNGRALCLKCETEFHIQHIPNPTRIGMKDEETNADAVWSNYFSLPRHEQLKLKRKYYHLLITITRFLHNETVW